MQQTKQERSPESEKYLQVLREAQFFKDSPDTVLEQVIDIAEVRTAASGDWLFYQDDQAEWCYLLCSGQARLVQHTASGADVTLHSFVRGDLMALLVPVLGGLYPASAEVTANTELLAFPLDKLWKIIYAQQPLLIKALHMVAGRLAEANQRIRELSAERVQQRIARSLLRLLSKVGEKDPTTPGAIRLNMRLSRQDIAQMNGTTLETVSRTLSGWEQAGLIRNGRERITILDPHALTAIAEDLVTKP